jgi:hypothetical protein
LVDSVEPVNRFALIVRPKRRYMDWANSLEDSGPRLTMEELPGMTEVYLVEASVDGADREALIDTYAEQIWESQLEGWSTDEDRWPVNRTPHTLRDWFDVAVTDFVFDAEPFAPLYRNDLDDVDTALTECAWCGKQLDPVREVISLSLTLGPNDPLRDENLETIAISVAGRDRTAVVAQPDSDASHEGHDLFFTLCSETCAKDMRAAMERERGAQLS